MLTEIPDAAGPGSPLPSSAEGPAIAPPGRSGGAAPCRPRGVGRAARAVRNTAARQAAALAGGVLPAAVEGQVPRELSQEGGQKLRPVGRHGPPGLQIGVVDALLGVLRAAQDVPGDGDAVGAVLLGCGGDGPLVPVPVQPDDFRVLHPRSPPFPLHLYTQLSAPDLTAETRISHRRAGGNRQISTPAAQPPKGRGGSGCLFARYLLQ